MLINKMNTFSDELQFSNQNESSTNRYHFRDEDRSFEKGLQAILVDISRNDSHKSKKAEVDDVILDSGKALVKFVNESLKMVEATQRDLEEQSKGLFKEITAYIEHSEELYVKYAKPALISILQCRENLKGERLKLTEVVTRVKYTVQNVKASAQAIFRGEITDESVIKMLVKHEIRQMQDLINKTFAVIDEAKKVYQAVANTFGLVKSNISTYQAEIQKFLNDNNELSNKATYRTRVTRKKIIAGKFFKRNLLR